MNRYQVTIEPLVDTALINLRCDEAVVRRIAELSDIALSTTPFSAVTSSAVTGARLSPDQWWLRMSLTREAAVFATLKAITKNDFAAVTVISDHFAGFRLTGPDVPAVLAQATSIDFSGFSGASVTRGKFARTGATYYLNPPATDVDLFVESSYADYARAWLQR